MKLLFVDTGAWVALNNSSDQFHSIAKSANEKFLDEDYFYITSDYVLDETYTFLLYNVGHHRAIQFGKEIKTLSEEGIIQIVQIAEDIQTEAWNIFESYSDKDFSFTDCTSFVVCNLLEITEVFSFDKHFEQYGLIRLPVF